MSAPGRVSPSPLSTAASTPRSAGVSPADTPRSEAGASVATTISERLSSPSLSTRSQSPETAGIPLFSPPCSGSVLFSPAATLASSAENSSSPKVIPPIDRNVSLKEFDSIYSQSHKDSDFRAVYARWNDLMEDKTSLDGLYYNLYCMRVLPKRWGPQKFAYTWLDGFATIPRLMDRLNQVSKWENVVFSFTDTSHRHSEEVEIICDMASIIHFYFTSSLTSEIQKKLQSSEDLSDEEVEGVFAHYINFMNWLGERQAQEEEVCAKALTKILEMQTHGTAGHSRIHLKKIKVISEKIKINLNTKKIFVNNICHGIFPLLLGRECGFAIFDNIYPFIISTEK